MAGPWEKYEAAGPWAKYGGGAEPVTAPASPRSNLPLSDPGNPLSFTTGNIWKGVAGVAGLPIDTASNVLNLGRAGYGAVKGAMGGAPPDLLGPQVGGSEWIQNLMRKTRMPVSGAPLISPASDPESTLGRYAASAIQMATGAGLPGAMAGRIGGAPRTLPNIPRAVAGGAVSGVTSELAGDIGGEEWKPLGAMIPFGGAAKTPGPGERATAARREQNFGKAKEMGIPIPPRAMKEDPVQQRLQNEGNREMGQPAGTAYTPEGMKAYRNSQWAAYENVMKDPSLARGLKPNAAFQSEITKLGDEILRARTELPETFRGTQPVMDLLAEYGYAAIPMKGVTVPPRQRPIPPDLAMRAIKKLRDDAATNFKGEKPEQIELAQVQKRIANSLEGLIESNLQQVGPTNLVQQFREARTAIAKSHDYEAAMEPGGRINPDKLARMRSEGAPMTGTLKDIGEVAGAFPGAMRRPQDSDLFSKRMSPHAAMHPQNWLIHMLQSATDPITLSRPYQAGFVDPRARSTPEQQRIQALLAAAMANQQGQIPAPPR